MLRLLFILLLAPTVGFASDKADPRAVEFCVEQDSNFVEVERCLPDAHVGYATLDAVEAIYGDAGLELSTRCKVVNDQDIVGAAVCAENAIESAIKLKSRLPAGATIPDPLFARLIDDKAFEDLEAATKTARGVFPEKRLWGGTMYQRLQ